MPVGYLECNHRRQLIRQGLFCSYIEEVEPDMTYLNRVIESPAPQSEPLPGMVPNSAGRQAYPVDDFTRLRRFLVLGSEGGSYYASERRLTLENAQAVRRCIGADGPRAVGEIVAVSQERRAPRAGPALFALALAASHGDDETRALAFEALPRWPAPAATCTSSRDTPTPCAAGAGACAGPSRTGTPPGPWPTPSTRRSSTATATAGPTATCCAKRTPGPRARWASFSPG